MVAHVRWATIISILPPTVLLLLMAPIAAALVVGVLGLGGVPNAVMKMVEVKQILLGYD